MAIADEFIEQRIDSRDIVIAGHSLGTGVAAQLAHRLTLEGTSSSLGSKKSSDCQQANHHAVCCKPVAYQVAASIRSHVCFLIRLIAPYTSIPKLLETYRLFKVLPILAVSSLLTIFLLDQLKTLHQPIRKIPYLHNLLLTYLKTQFNTRAIIDQIDCPILLIHGEL